MPRIFTNWAMARRNKEPALPFSVWFNGNCRYLHTHTTHSTRNWTMRCSCSAVWKFGKCACNTHLTGCWESAQVVRLNEQAVSRKVQAVCLTNACRGFCGRFACNDGEFSILFIWSNFNGTFCLCASRKSASCLQMIPLSYAVEHSMGLPHCQSKHAF